MKGSQYRVICRITKMWGVCVWKRERFQCIWFGFSELSLTHSQQLIAVKCKTNYAYIAFSKKKAALFDNTFYFKKQKQIYEKTKHKCTSHFCFVILLHNLYNVLSTSQLYATLCWSATSNLKKLNMFLVVEGIVNAMQKNYKYWSKPANHPAVQHPSNTLSVHLEGEAFSWFHD